MHTIIPAMANKDGKAAYRVRRDGRAVPAEGAELGAGQCAALWHGPAGGARLPCLFPSRQVEVERGISASARAVLAAKGHELAEITLPHGGGQMIMIDHERGILVGGSDPRKDGCALGIRVR